MTYTEIYQCSDCHQFNGSLPLLLTHIRDQCEEAKMCSCCLTNISEFNLLKEMIKTKLSLKLKPDHYIFHEDSDQVGTFCKEFIQKSTNEKAYLKFADIKIKFKESKYDCMIKDKDLKSLITKSLGIDWIKHIKIDNKDIYSVYKGIEWIPKEEEEEEEE